MPSRTPPTSEPLAGALGLSLLIFMLLANWLMQKLIERQVRRAERS